MILDDFKSVYKRFMILFGIFDNKFKIVMVLNDGINLCQYSQDNRCQIYQERPPICRLYPLSPYYDEVFIDTSCMAVNSDVKTIDIVKDGKIHQDFYNDRILNFKDKLLETEQFIQKLIKIDDNFVQYTTIKGYQLYRYNGSYDDEYIQMHKKSIEFTKSILP